MRRFSLQRLGEVTGRTVRRFPLSLVAAVVAGVSAALAVSGDEDFWIRFVMAGSLGIPSLTLIALVAERRERWGLPRLLGPIAQVVVVVLLVIYGFSLSRHLGETDILFFTQLMVGAHLLLAVLPFAGRGETRAMWQFDLGLALRFVTGAFFSVVLFGGLSLAIYALDTLLGVAVDSDVYPQLWFLIAFIFNTAYVLGGIPERLADLDHETDQPRVVKVFAQYVLAPLVMIYLAILLAYLVKVVATAEWPSGWIGYLVSSVAAAGILSLLLLKPDSDRDDRRWIRIYARLFHVLMVPAVVMLALAIFKRVEQYGVTENRYIMMVLTLWLAVVVIVGCFRRTLLLKAIPASLAALAFLTAIGPWSAPSVSHRSQLGRLERLLGEYDRFDGDHFVSAVTDVGDDDLVAINDQFRYLFSHFGADALGDRAKPDLQATLAAKATEDDPGRWIGSALTVVACEYLDIEVSVILPVSDRRHFSLGRGNDLAARPIAPYQHILSFELGPVDTMSFELDGERFGWQVDWAGQDLHLVDADRQPILTVDLDSLLAAIRRHDAQGTDVPDSLLETDGRSARCRARLRIEHIQWTDGDDGRPRDGILRGNALLDLTDEPRGKNRE